MVRIAGEGLPGEGPAGVELVLLREVYPHQQREDLQPLAIPAPPSLLALLHDRPDHGRGAADALVVACDTHHELVGHLHHANARSVAYSGPAVEQDKVIVALQLLAHGLEQDAATEAGVEVLPAEGIDPGGIFEVLASSRYEIEAAAAKIEVQAHRIGRQVGRSLEPGPAVSAQLRLRRRDHVHGEIPDEIDNALGGGEIGVDE